ncbi:MAG: hypothetical protein GXX79_16135 [Actinomycetales bacterium]|nr:hypothetical protein [Actinomycetales bacterium]
MPETPVTVIGITFTARRNTGGNRWQVFADHHFTPVGYLETSPDRVLVLDADNQPLGAGPVATYAQALACLRANLPDTACRPVHGAART